MASLPAGSSAYRDRVNSLLAKRSNPYELCKYEKKMRQQRIALGFPESEVIANRRTIRPQIMPQSEPDPEPELDSEEEERRSKVEIQHQSVPRRNPYPIGFSSSVFSIDFHPTRNTVAVGLVSGSVQLYSFSTEGKANCMLGGMKHHRESIRALEHEEDSELMYCCSADKSISIVNTTVCTMDQHWRGAHKAAINRIYSFNKNIIATGDDNGTVKLWDVRQGKESVHEFSEHTNYITDFTSQDKRFLLATSADGRMSVYDVRKNTKFMISENQEEELLCCSIVKGGTKIMVGTSAGNMRIFNWKMFAEISDQYPLIGDYSSVFCEYLQPTGYHTRNFAGCSDGRIRVLNFFPHKVVCEVGAHSRGYPIEAMALSHNNILATAGHDQKVRFFNVARFCAESDGEDSSEDEDEEKPEKPASADNINNQPQENKIAERVNILSEDVSAEDISNLKPLIPIKKNRRGFFSGF